MQRNNGAGGSRTHVQTTAKPNLYYTFTCSILRSPPLEQEQWGCKLLELVQPTRKLVETNYCVVMNRPITGDLTIHLYFVVLIKADHLRGTSPQQTTSIQTILSPLDP